MLIACKEERPALAQRTAIREKAKLIQKAPALPEAPALPAAPLGLPVGLPDVVDSATTPEKADLGHRLFFDRRLSQDGSMACVACHHIDKAYSSGQATDMKVGGKLNTRNTPSVLNMGYHTSFYWEGRKPTLEAVSFAAWTAQLAARPPEVVARLNAMPTYKALFRRAFQENATADNVPKALAAWLRALKSGNAPWDKAQAGDAAALPKLAQAGYKLFSSKGCVRCHLPPHFTDFEFHNVGVGDDLGRMAVTKEERDRGRFKTPSLRDVALTAPYFHDGKVLTLEEAISLMAAPKHQERLDEKLEVQALSKKEVVALQAFLQSLTGESTYVTPPQQLP